MDRAGSAAHCVALIALSPLLLGGAPEADVTLADLAWMAGTWEDSAAERLYEERWTPPADNAMLGMARTLRGSEMVFFEYLRIEARDDGIYFVAQPLGRPPTDFRLTRHADGEATFENPDHDFPKRIAYRRNADGTMTARADGGEGVEKGVQRFSFTRVRPD